MAVGGSPAARLAFGFVQPSSIGRPSASPPSIYRFPGRKSRLTKRRRPTFLRPILSSLVEKGEQKLSFTDRESVLVEALLGIQGRGRAASPMQLQDVEFAVETLESIGGLPDPTSSSMIEGCWQLIFTTRPGTASPIQRTFVGVDFFKIYQEVYLRTDDPRVSNIVRFSDEIGELKVEAAATIKDGKRILFQFDRAAFSFKFLPIKVPYPVPFRLLGDEAKGWLDTTYLSRNGNLRISRGNKGTTFVLQKTIEPRQRLLSAISVGAGVEEAVEEVISSQKLVKIKPETLGGEWQLLWTSQLENESWSSVAANGLKGLQIINDGRLENFVNLLPGLKMCANGSLSKTPDGGVYIARMDDGVIRLGALGFPLKIEADIEMELLYIDNKIRITRCNGSTLLVHLRLK
ncbi:probable plastid-lipid-associated protein 12, chloroplastic [Zingiber officinale]|uniref:probable plastid-lipid-associated protein 12, chloroplastic n=1 Tax=Zingiber officinale TaxID=94328 RepID=UPI001C4ADB87|nr:probable plastid-lipid-associated protein 12, chloroplastic [Zingiber officinale]